MSCLNTPGFSQWVHPALCLSGRLHCGTPAQPCGSGGMFSKEYCEETLHAEHRDPKLLQYRVSTIKTRLDDDTYGERLVGVFGPTKLGTFQDTSGIADAFPAHQLDVYGGQLQLLGGIGCRPETRADITGLRRDRDPCMDPVMWAPSGGPCRKTKARANLLDKDTVYGDQLGFVAPGPCDPEDLLPLVSVNIFGTECRYCPDFLWTTAIPCFGCSFDYGHLPMDAKCPPGDGEGGPANTCWGVPTSCCNPSLCWLTHNDNPECEVQFNVDDPVYYNPDWKFGCDSITHPGDPEVTKLGGPHHCPSCAWKQIKGRLVNRVLQLTQATQRMELKPIAPSVDNSGCGVFGWELKGSRRLDTYGCNVEENAVYYSAWCGPIGGECQDEGGVWHCAPGLFVRWNTGAASSIVSAKITFAQEELCDPGAAAGPCDTHPCRDMPLGCVDENYVAPSSEVIMRVKGRIEIRIAYQWADGNSADCCEGGGEPNWTSDTITIIGEFDTSMPWGKLSPSWDGYKFGDSLEYTDGGWQPGLRSPCSPLDPELSSPPGLCMNAFVNQGKWTDIDHIRNGWPVYGYPPKANPSHVVQEGNPSQHFCPPLMKWTWPGTGNKIDYTAQCWDVEAVRNSFACVDGDKEDPFLRADSQRYECTKLECRRGCTLGNPARDLRGGCRERGQPCFPEFDNDPVVFSVPWSGGQCVQ